MEEKEKLERYKIKRRIGKWRERRKSERERGRGRGEKKGERTTTAQFRTYVNKPFA